MVPPNLGSRGDLLQSSSWTGDSKVKVEQMLVKNVNLQTTCNDSLINALQGLKIDHELVVNPLDYSASNSLLDLSEGVEEEEWLLSASHAGSGKDGDSLPSQDWLKRQPSQDICDSEKKLLVDMLDGIIEQGPGDYDRYDVSSGQLESEYCFPRVWQEGQITNLQTQL